MHFSIICILETIITEPTAIQSSQSDALLLESNQSELAQHEVEIDEGDIDDLEE